MTNTVITTSLYALLAVVGFGFACPWLVSQADTLLVVAGFVLYGIAVGCVGMAGWYGTLFVQELLEVKEVPQDRQKKK